MKIVRLVLDKLYEVKALKVAKPMLDAVDAAMFGTDETTKGVPHIVDSIDTKRYMSCAIAALIPSTLASIYFYGFRAIMIIAVSYAAGMFVEFLFAAITEFVQFLTIDRNPSFLDLLIQHPQGVEI